MESKTIRVFRIEPFDRNQFDNVGNTISVCVTDEYDGINELLVIITPVASPEERLREARRAGLREVAEASGRFPSLFSVDEAVNIIERVDAEFAKEKP